MTSSRPTRLEIQHGAQDWDDDVNDNFKTLLDRPLPIAEHSGDETDLASTWPPSSYRNCFIWVNHSIDGWTLYVSDGSAWSQFNLAGDFTDLHDVPNSYAGKAGHVVEVNAGETALDFSDQTVSDLNVRLRPRIINLWTPDGTGTALGLAPSTTGTLSQHAVGSTNVLEACYSRKAATSASAGTSAGLSAGVAQCLRGSATNEGGFRFRCRFGFATTVAQQRAFIGLQPTAIGSITNVNPSTFTDCVGFAYDAAGTQLSIMQNDSSGSCTTAALGANFPVDTSSLYDVEITCLPNDTVISYSITNVSTGNSTSGTLSSNLPTNTTGLMPTVWVNNGTTASSAAVYMVSMSLEHWSI